MIRKAEVKDIFYMAKLERKLFKQTLGEQFLLQELTENPIAYYFVYEQTNEVIGYIGFRAYDGQAEMMNFLIASNYQDQGFGTELLTQAIEQLKQMNVKQISLEVRKSNKKAQHLYENHGFEIAYVRKQYYENEDGYVMIKEVQQ